MDTLKNYELPDVDTTIDHMLALTAEIADELLAIKDEGSSALPASLKLKILSLVEIASSTPDEPESASDLMEEPVPDEPEHAPDLAMESAPESTPAPEEVPVNAEEAPVAEDTPDEDAADEAPDDSPLLYEEELEAEAIEQLEETNEESAPAETLTELADDAALAASQMEEVQDILPATESAPEEPVSVPEKPMVSEESEVAEQSVESPSQPVTDFDTLRRAFSINDAFLYRRELFGGSPDRYLGTLREVAMLSSKAQLLDFLTNVKGIDIEAAPGKEFYTVLSSYFPD